MVLRLQGRSENIGKASGIYVPARRCRVSTNATRAGVVRTFPVPVAKAMHNHQARHRHKTLQKGELPVSRQCHGNEEFGQTIHAFHGLCGSIILPFLRRRKFQRIDFGGFMASCGYGTGKGTASLSQRYSHHARSLGLGRPPMSTSSATNYAIPIPVQRPTGSAELAYLKSTLRMTYRITIKDGRIFLGMFACTDKEKNIVLTNAEEFRIENLSKGRYVGLIMIPWRWITKAEVEQVM